MNNCSLKAGVKMARRTDPTKIEKIRKSAMDLIVDKGYGASSIGEIAKKAGVSSGYLYRHYSSKRELVDDLMDTNFDRLYGIFNGLVDKHITLKQMIEDYVRLLFNTAVERPTLAKFLAVIVFDPKFRLDQADRRKDNGEFINRPVVDFIEKIIKLGTQTGEINPKTTVRDILIIIFTIPFAHISYSFSLGPEEEDFDQVRIERITEICLNALK